jgi:hypothetical protein
MMTRKVAIFILSGDAACFGHALLKALEYYENGDEVKVIIEGPATNLIRELADPEKPFALTYSNVKKLGLIDCVCNTCSAQLGALKSAEEQGLLVCSRELEHPSRSRYIDSGYEVIDSSTHSCTMCRTWDTFEPYWIKQ